MVKKYCVTRSVSFLEDNVMTKVVFLNKVLIMCKILKYQLILIK
ncbi:hypothetical protein SAMN05192569_101040 [Parageobacillus thermantarcticus]|uniref:Uncharacterized protein n=1 Tax=Parageobacillus thermantarcticus TaxID=186116 RepID=A0A1I0T1Z6_9BACL|nr:hypothetical protein SAMN05192569_101040 [Parageobacillus thermantarcticus]